MIFKDAQNRFFIDPNSSIELELKALGYRTNLGCYFQDSDNRWWISLQLVKIDNGKAYAILDYVGLLRDRFLHSAGIGEIAEKWQECYDNDIKVINL